VTGLLYFSTCVQPQCVYSPRAANIAKLPELAPVRPQLGVPR
jgi:hypothetical protein